MSEEVEQHITTRFDLLRKIGSGAYGHVWKAKDKLSNQVVALKKIFDAFQHATDAQRTFRQINYLKQFNHKNIIKMKQVIKSENQKDVYIVFQYMEVDLHRVIRQDILKEKHKKYIIYQIAKALKYLHSAQLIHRDLKPSNILLNQQCHIKICDFGLVRSAGSTQDRDQLIMTQYVATRWYRSPQLLLGWTKYSKDIDIWSFGCLIAEMFKKKPLFPGSSTLDQIQKVIGWTGYPTAKDLDAIKGCQSETLISAIKVSKNRPTTKQSWFVDLDPKLKDLTLKMLQFQPSKRITIEEVLEHSYLQAFHDPINQCVSEYPIVLQIDDSIKLSVKQYRQRIWRFCQPVRPENTIHEAKKSEDLSYFSRSNLKRRSFKSTSKQQKSNSVSKTLYIKQKRLSNHLKSSVISPPILIKQSRTPSRQRRFTQTQTHSRNIVLSHDQHKSRYRNQSTNLQREMSLNNSNKVLDYEQLQSKKRSTSTVKNRRNLYNFSDYRKYFKVM